jgi:hydroxymethylbilane synthase
MTQKKIPIATYQSPLALWQANHIREKLLNHWPKITVKLLSLFKSAAQLLGSTPS